MEEKGTNIEKLNLETEPEEVLSEPERKPWHPEKARIRLAYWVLGGIFIIFILTVFSNFFVANGLVSENMSWSLFEFCKTGLLPIVTLILGFYFSKDKN